MTTPTRPRNLTCNCGEAVTRNGAGHVVHARTRSAFCMTGRDDTARVAVATLQDVDGTPATFAVGPRLGDLIQLRDFPADAESGWFWAYAGAFDMGRVDMVPLARWPIPAR